MRLTDLRDEVGEQIRSIAFQRRPYEEGSADDWRTAARAAGAKARRPANHIELLNAAIRIASPSSDEFGDTLLERAGRSAVQKGAMLPASDPPIEFELFGTACSARSGLATLVVRCHRCSPNMVHYSLADRPPPIGAVMRESDTLGSDLLALSDAAYEGVETDPARYRNQPMALLVRARREGSAEELVAALRASAWSEHIAQRNTAALSLLGEAVALAESHALDRRLGHVLVTRAAVCQELGRFEEAQRDLDRATPLLRSRERMQLEFQQGILLHNRGRLHEAAVHYRLVLADPSSSPLLRAKAGNNLGYLESERGDSAAARAVLEAAWEAAQHVGPALRALVAHTRAWIEMHAGRLTESLTRSDDAIHMYAAAGLPIGEPLIEYADGLAELRLLPEALRAAEDGLAALPAEEVPLMAADALLRVARMLLLAGDVEAARVRASACAALLERQDRPGRLVRARVVELMAASRSRPLSFGELGDIARYAADLEKYGMRSDAVEAYLLAGRCAIDAGHPDEAESPLRAVDRLSRRTPVLMRMRGHLASALLAELAGSPRAVLAAARSGLRDLDRHRGALPTMELRARASSHGAELGALGLRAVCAGGTPTAVFHWLERTRAAALSSFEPVGKEDDGGKDEMSGIRMLYGELAEARADSGSEPPALLARIATAEAGVRRASWSTPVGGGTAMDSGPTAAPRATTARLPRLHDARERLRERPGQVLVEYGALDGRLLAVVIDGRRSRLIELGPVEGLSATIDSALFALRRLARPVTSPAAAHGAMRSARAALSSLAERLVVPLGLPAGAPVVVVPVGDLQRVPWAPLHPGPTTVSPSTAAWLRTLTPIDAPVGLSVAIVGGPDLPGVAAELAVVAAQHRAATILAPPDSTCEAVSALVRTSDVAHFACHGRLRADNPSFSSLLLSDGPLTVHELSRRSGSPRIVVLAACESGAQVGFPGEETLGFVSALLSSGSAGVIASKVLVSDEGSLSLMRDLHTHLASRATAADALWSARLRLDTDDPHQFASWCAFDAYGGG